MAQPTTSLVSMQRLIEAGAHYGHRKRFRHPSFKEFIFGERNGLHIINLETTKKALEQAAFFCSSVGRSGGRVMFVCTKRSGAEAVREEAIRCDMPYITNRWLGGLMSNFNTVRKSITRMEDLEKETVPEKLRQMTKKEGLRMLAKLTRLKGNLAGVRDMDSLPNALFVIDAGHHRIAICEANKIGIPVVAVVDSNCSTAGINYVIPGNDDSSQANRIYLQTIADAIIAGRPAAPDSDGNNSDSASNKIP